jgi:hypothetical protein
MRNDREVGLGPESKAWGEAPMTTIQAVFLGIMLALTPSLVLLAFLIWREGIGLRSESDAERFRI